MKPQRLLASSVIGAFDQALLSAFNLGLGVAFIKLASKADYAEYALVTTALLLVQSVQNALVSSPLATLLPGADGDMQRKVVADAGACVQQWLMSATILGGSVAAALAWVGAPLLWPLVAAGTLAAMGVLSREYVRARFYVQRNALAALRSDVLYVSLASAGLGLLLWHEVLSTPLVLATIGTAGLLSGLVVRTDLGWPRLRLTAPLRDGLHAIWGCAKWALPSVVNSWLYANAYLYMVGRLISKDAVADLSASRLLLVPMSLLVVGWSSAFRPRASRWLSDGLDVRVHRVAIRSAGAFLAVGLLYGLALYALMPLLQHGLLGEKYRAAGPIAAIWLLFFTATAVRTVGMSAMLASTAAFRVMYAYSLISLAIALPGVWLASMRASLYEVIGALLLAELVMIAMVFAFGWPAIRRKTSAARH